MSILDIHLVIDTLFFVTLAIFLGYLVDVLIPNPKPNETFWESLAWIYIQIAFAILILFSVDQLYMWITGIGAESFYGLNVYGVIFFLVQTQLVERVRRIFNTLDEVFIPQKVFR